MAEDIARDMSREAAVISARGLTKRYDGVIAVDGLDLDVFEGEIFGLLGPNGAGKTTTILMLMGLTEPSAGSVRVCGFDPVREPLRVKRLVGYLPDRVSFYEDMTAEENLLFTAALNDIDADEGRRRATALLQRVGLADAAARKVREFSRGMIQRLGLADVLIKQPRVVVLDEPTLGIDPAGVQEVLDFIVGLSRSEHITVMLSTHLLYQVQEICDRIGIFSRGKAVAVGRIRDLSLQATKGGPFITEVEVSGADAAAVQAVVEQIEDVTGVRRQGAMLVVESRSDVRERISRLTCAVGGVPVHLCLAGHGLDEIYRRYFQEEHRGGGLP